MADTAVAVHPDDPRYRALIGKQVWRPLAREKLPIIADAAIDPKFGTGVLKVTPAHDKLDFEIGLRHSLQVIDILHPDGRINCPAVPELDGLDRFAARQKSGGVIGKARPAGERGTTRKQRRVQRAQRGADRAASKRAMVSALSENKGSARRGARSSHPLFSRSTGRRFTCNGWRTSRIGASVARFGGATEFRPGIAVTKTTRSCRLESPRQGLDAGSRHARYLVLFVALGLRDDGRGDAAEILSHVGARDGSGHHFLLGRAHDHRRP